MEIDEYTQTVSEDIISELNRLASSISSILIEKHMYSHRIGDIDNSPDSQGGISGWELDRKYEEREDDVKTEESYHVLCLGEDGYLYYYYDERYRLKKFRFEEVRNRSWLSRIVDKYHISMWDEYRVFDEVHYHCAFGGSVRNALNRAEQVQNEKEGIRQKEYASALDLRSQKKYVEAIRLFKSLGDYKDSALQAKNVPAYAINRADVGDTLLFGAYRQDDDPSNGKEPITWRVLEVRDGKALLLSIKCLDAGSYNKASSAVNWATCTLRVWLNTSFMNFVFTEEEISAISQTSLVNHDNPVYGTPGGVDTTDKIFLLSIEEVRKHFTSASSLIGPITAYAKTRGANDSVEEVWWWLRTPGGYDCNASGVSSRGSIYEFGNNVNTGRNAIRPAIWLNLESPIFKPSAKD